MRKVKFLMAFLLIFILAICLFFVSILRFDDDPNSEFRYDFVIINKTNNTFNDFKIAFSNDGSNIVGMVPVVEPKETTKFKLYTDKFKSDEEGSTLWLVYKDKQNRIQKILLDDYLEVGIGGASKIHILGIDQNGIIKVKLKTEWSFY